MIRQRGDKGKGEALRSLRGREELGADVAVTFDGDAQHFPAEIPKLSAQGEITALTLTYELSSFTIAIFGPLALFTDLILSTISSAVRKSQHYW